MLCNSEFSFKLRFFVKKDEFIKVLYGRKEVLVIEIRVIIIKVLVNEINL